MEPRHQERKGLTRTRWHRPVSYYMQEPLGCGFIIRAVLEPTITEEGRILNPAATAEIRRVPPILIVRADKPRCSSL